MSFICKEVLHKNQGESPEELSGKMAMTIPYLPHVQENKICHPEIKKKTLTKLSINKPSREQVRPQLVSQALLISMKSKCYSCLLVPTNVFLDGEKYVRVKQNIVVTTHFP